MSKRFGRNQKRRMRSAIFEAELKAIRFEEAHRASNALAKYQGERILELERVLEEAYDVLQNNSAALPAGSINVSDKRARFINLPVDDVCPLGYETQAVFKISRLRVLLADVADDKIRFGKHVRVTFGNEQFGYAIDDMAIASVPKQLLISRISEQLAIMISNKLKEAA